MSGRHSGWIRPRSADKQLSAALTKPGPLSADVFFIPSLAGLLAAISSDKPFYQQNIKPTAGKHLQLTQYCLTAVPNHISFFPAATGGCDESSVTWYALFDCCAERL